MCYPSFRLSFFIELIQIFVTINTLNFIFSVPIAMVNSILPLLVATLFATSASSVPVFTTSLRARALLGSSFGVPGRDYTFDYVVVGGGMAGLTLAARLAEDRSLLVGVVEAGTFYEISNGNYSEIPGLDIQNVGKDVNDWHPGNDWGFVTTPQSALLNVTAHYPRGKMLGGSSARNYMTCK